MRLFGTLATYMNNGAKQSGGRALVLLEHLEQAREALLLHSMGA